MKYLVSIKILKRLVDLIISTIVLLVLLPAIIAISVVLIVIYHSSPFFIQVRPGLHSKPFTFYKFRTMTKEKDAKGELLHDKNRITKVGSFLRKTSLDELPSLWNVLKGNMSMVGPRPLLMEYLNRYSPEQARRHEVKPGITGWAQVNGRNAISWEEKFKLDVWYVDNQSFWLDLKILFITIFKVLKGEGISHARHVTMVKFQGKKI